MTIYDEYRHYVGVVDYYGKVITSKELLVWSKDIKRKFICVFCGIQPKTHNGFVFCPRCREYKGIIPDIDRGENE